MNRKILTFAVAATLAAPMAAYADVKVSGLIQAEAASWEAANDVDNVHIKGYDDNDRQMLTNDVGGVIFNEGPNYIGFHIDEKLGSGVSAFALYTVPFDTSGNRGLSGQSDAWLGLKTRNFYMKYGTITGAYKSSRDIVDPWAFTSLQATGTGGGMSGSTYHSITGNPITGYIVDPTASTHTNGLANEGFVDGALELGVKFGGFTARLQGVVDDRSDMDGAGLLELRYSAPNFAMWLAGSFTDLEGGLEDIKDEATADLDDALGDINETIGRDEAAEESRDAAEEARLRADEDSGLGNWKIGGKFNLGPMVELGLQYEDAEIGTFDWGINPDGGKYILGSLAVNMNNVVLAGWVSGYLSDIDDQFKMIDTDGELIGEDALSWAVGAKYLFSKRSQVYLGYRQTDSDNDYRDENLVILGIRHTF
jgi:predicted porin